MEYIIYEDTHDEELDDFSDFDEKRWNSSKQSTPVPSFSQNQLYTTIAEHMASIDPLIKGLSFPRAIRTQLASLQKNIEEQSFGFFLEYKYQLMKLIQSLYHEELGKSKNEVNCRELRMLCQSLISFDIEIEETLLENVLPESIKALKEIGAMNSYDSYLQYRTDQLQLPFEERDAPIDVSLLAQKASPLTILPMLQEGLWNTGSSSVGLSILPLFPQFEEPIAIPSESIKLFDESSIDIRSAQILHATSAMQEDEDASGVFQNPLNASAEEALRFAVGSELRNAGFDSFESNALELVSDVARRHLEGLGQGFRGILDVERRCDIDYEILAKVFKRQSVVTSDLLSYINEELSERKERVDAFESILRDNLDIPQVKRPKVNHESMEIESESSQEMPPSSPRVTRSRASLSG